MKQIVTHQRRSRHVVPIIPCVGGLTVTSLCCAVIRPDGLLCLFPCPQARTCQAGSFWRSSRFSPAAWSSRSAEVWSPGGFQRSVGLREKRDVIKHLSSLYLQHFTFWTPNMNRENHQHVTTMKPHSVAVLLTSSSPGVSAESLTCVSRCTWVQTCGRRPVLLSSSQWDAILLA